ncbi:MAG: YceI family protein [Bacteroidota bacterium]
MKRTIYAAFVFAALGLTACKGDSENTEGKDDKKTEQKADKKEDKVKNYALVANESKLDWKGTWIKPAEEGDSMVETKNHMGTVQLTDGKIKKEGKNVSGKFVVDLTTISNSDLEGKEKEKFTGHMKSPDFFNVEEHAKAEVELKNIKDGSADITIHVLGMKLEETVPVMKVTKGDKMMLEGEFGIDMSPLEFKMMSPNPEKPEKGHIDPTVDFTLNATLKHKK